MTSFVATQYSAGVAAGRIERDDAQLGIIDVMARLEARIALTELVPHPHVPTAHEA